MPRLPRRSAVQRAAAVALVSCGVAVSCGAPPPHPAVVAHAADRAPVQPLRGAAVCEEGAAPTSVAIIGTRQDGLAFVYCTGTLIAPDVVLVAAHCITETTTVAQHVSLTADLRFLPAADPATRDETLAASVPVRRSAPHPDYDGGSHAHDVGLFFLDAPLLDVTPAIVLEAADDASSGAGVAAAFSGYGYDEDDVFGLKRCAEVVVSRSDGVHLYVDSAADVPQGCNGDSGAGLFVEVPTEHARTDRVAGVASYTAPSCTGFTGFADVRLDRDFLDAQMQDCSDRAWCDVQGLIPASAYDPPPPSEGEGEGEADGDEAPGGCASGSAAPVLALALGALATQRRRRLVCS